MMSQCESMRSIGTGGVRPDHLSSRLRCGKREKRAVKRPAGNMAAMKIISDGRWPEYG